MGEAGKGKGGQILYSSDLNIRTVGHEHLWNGQKKIEAGEACERFHKLLTYFVTKGHSQFHVKQAEIYKGIDLK